MSTPRTPMSPSSWEADALSLYQRLLPASFWEPLQKRPDRRQNNRLYNLLVVMWLLIAQRLHRLASLETAVLELLRGLPPSFWPRPCQRLRDWRAGRKLPSGNTGAYNQARQGQNLDIRRFPGFLLRGCGDKSEAQQGDGRGPHRTQCIRRIPGDHPVRRALASE